jgi:two-component system sensor histidine kinase KdpD
LLQRALRLLAGFTAVAAITFTANRIIPVNATTVGFAYLLAVLVMASTWGFLEAALSSILATLFLNFYFFPPVGTLTIADAQNWVALFSFLTTSMIASRLSTKAKRRALDAIERRQDVERLYSFSRAILLIGGEEPFPGQLIRKLAETFGTASAVLYVRRTAKFYRAGEPESAPLDTQLVEAATHGTAFSDSAAHRMVTAIRLGSEPIASLAVSGVPMADAVLQGIANLVAIGLERDVAQDLAHQVEAARQSEQLRITIIDAMAHEFKTPLTLIKGATSSILSGFDSLSDSTREQLTIADEEAGHLADLMDNAIEMARLDTTHIDVRLEMSNLEAIVQESIASLRAEIDDRLVDVTADEPIPEAPLDRRLMKLAFKQILDNALKYSDPGSPVKIHIGADESTVTIDVTNQGAGISAEDRERIFERFFRSAAIRTQIPGSGLGLNIAHSIVKAHHGQLTVTSRPGETTFRMSLPAHPRSGGNN